MAKHANPRAKKKKANETEDTVFCCKKKKICLQVTATYLALCNLGITVDGYFQDFSL